MDVVIFQNRNIYTGNRHFVHLPTCLTALSESGNKEIHVVDHYSVPRTEDFRSVYRHISNNPHFFEFWCFERWFILEDWMRANSKDIVFTMDSDVLAFCPVDWVYSQVSGSLTLSNSHPAGSKFVTREGVNLICDYLIRFFKENMAGEVSPEDVASGKNICSDMSVIDPELERLGQPSLQHGYEWVIDNNVGLVQPGGTAAPHGYRDVIFFNGIPHWFNDERTVKGGTLHCWGRAKPKMKEIWEQSRRSVDGKPVRMWL